MFQWTKQWYPIAVVEFLDPGRPQALQLLGKDVIIWRDGGGKWRCFEDACPHRLAPLSEGRVESDGTLMCAYHAWRFDSQGRCVSIPQSQDKETEAKHCANPKSRARVHPTREDQGLLWVWAESGPQAQEESLLTPPRSIDELEEDSDKVLKLFWNIRDLPYGWDFFMENVADPAHVPVSHHGLVGDRYRDAKYYDMPRVREISTDEGFSFAITPTAPSIAEAVHDFQPPCLMKITTTFTDEGKLILVLYATPTRPGWCRHIGCQVLVKNKEGNKPEGLAFFALPMPPWLGHVLASFFLHQDLVFLHYQEKIVAKHRSDKSDKWLDRVFTPNPQDKMTITLRQWLALHAGGGIPWDEGIHDSDLPPEERDKAKLFDVWNTHTKNCVSCQKALKTLDRLRFLSYVGAVICSVWAITIDARAFAYKNVAVNDLSFLDDLPPAGFWWGIVAAAVLLMTAYSLQKFTRLFYVYEFEHARND